ncbi:MAG: ROK family protein, partial [Verrucomicrobia bacterium]|nr:ROK family protein [Verrucomicrobiota bacterium]
EDIFLDLRKVWNHVPFEVANDGEVTALAGSMSLNDNSVLGLAFGTSTAGGYVNSEGNITSWLNEFAFVPVDYQTSSAVDEWSGDYGCGDQFFSQQAVNRLLKTAKIEVESNLGVPERLKFVQDLMAQNDVRARQIYETLGTYLGYQVAHFTAFYEIKHLLILGRVTTGEGGNIIVEQARNVLRTEFPELAEKLAFHMPDEKEKRHGQAIAAASLPSILAPV